MYKLVFVLFCLLLWDKPLPAQFVGLRIYHENDYLSSIGKNYDDNYTGGCKAEILTNTLNFTPLMRKKVFNPMNWSPLIQSLSFSFATYTPTDIGNPNIDYTDRPYASYTAINFGFAFLNPFSGKQEKLSYELSLGAMGKRVAGDFQKFVHGHHTLGVTRPYPQGWGYQIAEGGAFAANLRINFLKMLSKDSRKHWFQFSWMHDLNLGQCLVNYTQGLRLYVFNTNNNILSEGIPEIPVLTGPRPNDGRIHFPGIQHVNKKLGFTFFVTPRGKVVLHNAALTGKLIPRESVYVLPSNEMKNFLVEYDACFFLNWKFVQLGYTQYGRSAEYTKEKVDFHHWGGIFLGVFF